MNKPLDLDAIREQYISGCVGKTVADDVQGLISEVEALRTENELIRTGAIVNETALTAKLKKVEGLIVTSLLHSNPQLQFDALQDALTELKK